MVEFLKARIKWLLLQVVPWPVSGSATAFAEAAVNSSAATASIKTTENAIASANDDIASQLVAHAQRMLGQEDQRQTSVMGRAQSLFFAVAILSSLLSVGAGFLLTSHTARSGETLAVSLIIAMLVMEIILLAINLAKAIQGIDYERAGNSEVAKWASYSTVGALHRNEAVETLRWYRQNAHVNTWRFRCLNRALTALRNVVIGSGLLILVILGYANWSSPPGCTDKSEFHGGTVITYSVECPVQHP
jgi:hypothetical protein